MRLINNQPVRDHVQAIVVSDSLEMGFHGQSASETTLSTDLGEVSLTYAKV